MRPGSRHAAEGARRGRPVGPDPGLRVAAIRAPTDEPFPLRCQDQQVTSADLVAQRASPPSTSLIASTTTASAPAAAAPVQGRRILGRTGRMDDRLESRSAAGSSNTIRPSAARSSRPSVGPAGPRRTGDRPRRREAYRVRGPRAPLGPRRSTDHPRPLREPARDGRFSAADRSGEADPDCARRRRAYPRARATRARRSQGRHPRRPARSPPGASRRSSRPPPDRPARARDGSYAGRAASARRRGWPSAACRRPSTTSPSAVGSSRHRDGGVCQLRQLSGPAWVRAERPPGPPGP